MSEARQGLTCSDLLGFSGSDEAFARVEKMINEWSETRSGRMEEFAEFVMLGSDRNLDKLLTEFFKPNDQCEPVKRTSKK